MFGLFERSGLAEAVGNALIARVRMLEGLLAPGATFCAVKSALDKERATFGQANEALAELAWSFPELPEFLFSVRLNQAAGGEQLFMLSGQRTYFGFQIAVAGKTITVDASDFISGRATREARALRDYMEKEFNLFCPSKRVPGYNKFR